MKIEWEDNSTIKVRVENNATIISANTGGLVSLAKIMNMLSEEPGGYHIHLDQYNSLEDESGELIIEKIDDEQSE